VGFCITTSFHFGITRLFITVGNNKPNYDKVIFSTDNGLLYSFYKDEWEELTDDIEQIDNISGVYPCRKMVGPPPRVFFMKIIDSAATENLHSLGIDSRCYAIQLNGDIHLWTRIYGAWDMILLGFGGLISGAIVGGVIREIVRKKSKERYEE